MSWMGSASLRIVALQTEGSAGDLEDWGAHWGERLKRIGATVGILTETRIASADGHRKAINGLLSAGYIAISHNVEISRDSGEDADSAAA